MSALIGQLAGWVSKKGVDKEFMSWYDRFQDVEKGVDKEFMSWYDRFQDKEIRYA
jgi:hypothetical protein